MSQDPNEILWDPVGIFGPPVFIQPYEPQEGQSGQGSQGGQGPGGKSGHGKGGDVDVEINLGPTIDDHSVWSNDPLAQASHIDWLKDFRDNAKKNGMWGDSIGNLSSEIDKFLKPRVNWEKYLKRFIGQYVRIGSESTRKRPNRRHGWDAAGRKTLRSGKILVAIDSSGSIGASEAQRFLSEVSGFVDQIEVVVCSWDTAVHSPTLCSNKASLIRWAKDFKGGGGTDVMPLFSLIADPSLAGNKASLFSNIDAMVVLTDGFFSWPSSEWWNLIPVFWGITVESNVSHPPFGVPIFVSFAEEK